MIVKKIRNPKVSSTKAQRVGRLVDYIQAPEAENGSEKCIHTGAHGFVFPEHAKAEMIALAQEARRSKDPIAHYVLSWQEGEQPTARQADEAAETFMRELGLEGHQVIYGLHTDTDNRHLHLAINRVHPTTLHVVKINKGFDLEAAHRAIALIEHAQGWKREANGRYQVTESGKVVKAVSEKPQQQPHTARRDIEHQTGEKSAERLAIEKAGPIIRQAKSWDELHKGLAAVGMRYERTGSGAVIHVGEVAIKASSADRAASLAQLQKRLGIYQSPDQEKPHEYHSHTAKPHPLEARPLSENRMQRLSQCRVASADRERKGPGVLQLDARAGRRAPEGVRRSTGRGGNTGRTEPVKQSPEWLSYTAEREAYQAERARLVESLKEHQAIQREALLTQHREQREKLFRRGEWRGKGAELNIARSVIAAQQAAEKLALKDQHSKERKAIFMERPPFPFFKDWNAHRSGQIDLQQKACRISGDTISDQAETRDLRDFSWVVDGQSVRYVSTALRVDAFIDTGRWINVIDERNPAAVLAAMQLGAQKFGKLELTGSDEFKALACRLAVEHGITISNPELQPVVEAARAELALRRTVKAPRSGGIYIGEIVAVTGDLVIQDSGRGKLIAHPTADFIAAGIEVPRKGQTLEIARSSSGSVASSRDATRHTGELERGRGGRGGRSK